MTMKPMRAPRTVKVKPMTPGIPHNARLRAYLTGAALTLGLVGIAARAWGLQVSEASHYRELAARQHAINVEIPAPRGDVIDTLGRPLAVSADADSIWANPREIHDVTETAAKLAPLIGADDAALEAKLGVDRRFVWIARHVEPGLAQRVRAAKLPGIVVTKEPRRWYPGRAIGGPVIGRADIDGNGLDGIELAMNAQLTGTRGGGGAVRDAKGHRMYADGLAQPEAGATIKLTLDRSIQAIADQAIADSVIKNKAKSGTVVVLDVATSHVLAMASYPTYDSNTGEGIAQGARNRPVTDAFEAGSVMKLFTIAGALDAGAVTPDTWFEIGGALQIGRKSITDVHANKALTVSGIIKHSSNIGAVKVSQRLGREKMYATFKRFGFGARSGIELPGEQVGMLRGWEKWRDIEFATMSYGYGLTITPLQLAAAVAAIGNDGLYRAPRIVESITAADGAPIALAHDSEARAVITPKTAAEVRAMMASVFERGKEGGTGKDIVVPGFRCGGKTGTAHKWDAEAHKYADHRHLSSFVGLAPIDKPRLAIVVLVDEPSGGDYFGGVVAGPVFAVVASEALRYLGVPGESLICPPPPPGPVNPLAILPAKTCIIPAPKPPKGGAPAPAAPVSVPELPLINDAPPTDDEPAAEGDGVAIPDFRGMSVRRAIDTAHDAHLPIVVHGAGRVISQEPMPGTVPGATAVVLQFSDEDPRILHDAPASH